MLRVIGLRVMLKNPNNIIICEKDENRIRFINEYYPDVLTVSPEECIGFVRAKSNHGGADVVLKVASTDCLIFQNGFRLGARMMLEVIEE